MKPVLVIVGPTGIGKTGLSEEIASLMPVEIVSADSRQIYKSLDIGTAKPPGHLLKSVPHHMINFLRPDEYFSAGMFSQIGRKIIEQIQLRDHVALVVGGSGLYVRALIDGLNNIEVRDEKIRTSLRNRMIYEGLDALYQELLNRDPDLAKRLSPNDSQRILRGLEVYLVTGKKMSVLQEAETKPANFQSVMYGLTASREILYQRINQRVEDMLENGLLAEVANLKLRGLTPALNSLNTVGYKEVFDYLDDRISYDQMIELVKRNSRRYAKRQMTWFRKDTRISWIEVEQDTDLSEVAHKIVATYNQKYLNS